MANNTIAINQLFSFAQSAYFFNALQNYQYLPYDVAGGAFGVFQGDGGFFTSKEINEILAGKYERNSFPTYPQLNIGDQKLPLSIFKNLESNLVFVLDENKNRIGVNGEIYQQYKNLKEELKNLVENYEAATPGVIPKKRYKFENTPGITRFLDILKNEFAENPRGLSWSGFSGQVPSLTSEAGYRP